MMNLSPLLRRILAISLIILPLSATALYVVLPLFETYSNNNQKIHTNRLRLAGYKNSLQLYSTRLTALKNAKPVNHKKNLLTGKTKNLALADLQSKLKQLAARYQTLTLRTNYLSEQKSDGLELIGLQIVYRGHPDNILKLLHQIESQRPYLFVQDALFTSNSANYAPSHNIKPILTVNLKIYGAYWSGDVQ